MFFKTRMFLGASAMLLAAILAGAVGGCGQIKSAVTPQPAPTSVQTVTPPHVEGEGQRPPKDVTGMCVNGDYIHSQTKAQAKKDCAHKDGVDQWTKPEKS